MMFPEREILLATRNLHKIEEITDILKNEPVDLKTLLDFPHKEEAVEDGMSYEENARIKALYYSQQMVIPSLADDSGLEIEYLGGRPGLHSARFIDKKATFRSRNIKILEWMKDVEEKDRHARFVCVVALAIPEGPLMTFRGELPGMIAHEIRGTHGFGYDPIFFLPEYGKTLAELESQVKNQISHRARALRAAHEFIVSLAGQKTEED